MFRPTQFALALSAGVVAGLAACSSSTTKEEDRVTAAGPLAASVDAEGKAKGERSDAPKDLSPEPARADDARTEFRESVSTTPPAASPAAMPKPLSPPPGVVAAGAAQMQMQTMKRMQIAPPAPAILSMPAPVQAEDRENYAHLDANPVHVAATDPVSTFSIDVDTGSYSNVRRFLRDGRLPPQDAVRVEELVNYFDYAYAPPKDRGQPFALTTEMAATPWNAKTELLHIGIQGWKPEVKPAGANLVFLVDVSGSMESPDKLPLVVSALKMLTQEMTAKDRISLVVYAGNTGVVLEPTPGDRKATILAALERLQAGGSTNGAAGIDLAYAMAKKGWIEGGVNRVMLATDGDFNVGTTSFESLIDMVETRRKSGVALTTLGFGTGNYNDKLMERLADAGDGNYAYIDSAQEAEKVLVRQREATLTTIARDVKIQVEFNPALVSEYRLIGYEDRVLNREDFNNDAVDAADIGAGHTVTALYEVTLAGSGGERNDPLRYGKAAAAGAHGDEIANLRLRWKRPQDGSDAASRLIERPLKTQDVASSVAATSPQFRLSAAVAGFGQLLTGGRYTGTFDYTAVGQLAAGAGDDAYGERAEFRQLVELAASLANPVGANGKPAEVGG